MEVQSLNCSGVAAPESGDTSGRQKVSLTMKIRTLKSNPDFGRRAAAALGAGVLLLPWAAQATLENRDLNGDGVVDAFYDTDLDITWLRDANVLVSAAMATPESAMSLAWRTRTQAIC